MKTKSIILVPIVCILTFFSCSKEIIDDEHLNTDDKVISKVTNNYIVDDKSYPVVVAIYSDNRSEVLNELDPILEEVLAEPTSTLLKDPFNEFTYYVFRSEKESMEKNAEIIAKLNEYENSLGDIPQLKDGHYGQLEMWRDIDGGMVYYVWLVNDVVLFGRTYRFYHGEIPQVSYNDEISAYRVWSHTLEGPRSDGKRIVVRFYEHSNFGGHVLTAYCFFRNYVPGSAGDLSWADYNMHYTLMQGGLFPKYWGDQVSSIRWQLE